MSEEIVAQARGSDADGETPEISRKAVLAIDPGYEQSAYVLFTGAAVRAHGIEENEALAQRLASTQFEGLDAVVLESIESFGMAVGREVFETVFYTGRLYEIARRRYGPVVERLSRRDVKQHLCHHARATDSNVRVALTDRFGGKAKACGVKKVPGVLYGIKSHEWSALALAVTWWDRQHPDVAGIGMRDRE